MGMLLMRKIVVVSSIVHYITWSTIVVLYEIRFISIFAFYIKDAFGQNGKESECAAKHVESEIKSLPGNNHLGVLKLHRIVNKRRGKRKNVS